jgi:histidinol-phosphate aminotransferase
MAFASSELIKYLNKVKPPYNIGTETQKIALGILSDITLRKDECQLLIKERSRIQAGLKNLSVVKHIYPSDANFLLIRFDHPLDILKYLIDQNIIVRNRSTLPGCEGCLRITVGTIEENNRLISALNAYVVR